MYLNGNTLPRTNMTKTNSSKTYTLAGLASIAAIAALSGITAGCENSDKTADVSWNGAKPASAAVADPANPSSSSSTAPAASAGDAVPFGSLSWSYGGFNGSGAAASEVTLSGLNISGGGMSFTYVKDLSAWGLGGGDIGGVASLFVKNNAGKWVGGKFDFISSSRSSRSFTNINDGYNGWSLSDVPNPCEAAFVIVKADGSKRSNVIGGTWAR